MIRFFGGALLGICLAGAAWAWNAEGHMLVSQIAYNHLDPAVKTACDNLIAVSLPQSSTGTSSFVTAAVWADDFKTTLKTGTCHYFDLPFSLDNNSTATAWAAIKAEPMDVVRAIRQCIALLQSSTASQADRAQALRYLLHYVADVHQPMHGTTNVTTASLTGDAGGNGFTLTGTWSNLHSLWDAGGGFNDDSLARPLTGSGQTTLNNIIANIEATYPYVPNPGTIPDPMDWVEEDLELARTVGYVGVTENTTPSGAYLSTVSDTAKLRLGQAGHRLADLLNTIMVSTSDIPTLDVTEAEIEVVTANTATTPGPLTIDASGNLILWDSTDASLVRLAPDGITGITVTTLASLLTAINTANGTTVAPTTFAVSALQMAADGDIVMLGQATGSVETLISVTNAASGTIKVISSPVSGGANPIDGATDFCMAGNTAFICLDTTLGASEDKIVSLNTNDLAAPSPTVTVVSTSAQLNSAFGTSGNALRPSPIVHAPNGTIWLCDSGSTGVTDNWVEVTTSTGAAVLAVAKSDTLADLIGLGYTAGDVGYIGAVFSPAGNLYCLNQYGSGTADESVLELASPGAGSATTYIRDLAQVQIDSGGDGTWSTVNTFGSTSGAHAIAYSATKQRVYAVLSTAVGSKGIVSYSALMPVPIELSEFAAH